MRDVIHIAFLKLWRAWYKLWNKQKPKKHHKKLSGELIVTGKDYVSIFLGEKSPKDVSVKFKGHCHTSPCNPSHYVDLSYSIVSSHYEALECYSLQIFWHVTDVRVIDWQVVI